jgi:hypothetical protein
MTNLHRHELLSLLYDKLTTIGDIVETSQGDTSLKSLRHALGEIKRVSARACALIDEYEPCEDSGICSSCQRVPIDG